MEYPTVVAGTFAAEFLHLPEEVLTTTMIHHQHYFPVVDDAGRLMPAFLAVTNIETDNARAIAVNAERVLTARLRDAQFFWEADRKATLESRLERLGTLLFHKRLGSYRAQGAAPRARRRPDRAARASGRARGGARARWRAASPRPTSSTDMVREFTELQGTMGGIYARHEGLPEAVCEGDLLPLPAGRRRAERAAAARGSSAPARSRGRRCRSPTSSTRSSACSPPASGRPARAIRWRCAGRRRGCCACSSICPS